MMRRYFCHILNVPKIHQPHESWMKLALRHAQAAYREKEIPVRYFMSYE